MNHRTFWNSLVSVGLCFALIAQSLVGIAFAQEDNAALITRLQNRPKLQIEGKKFESAVANLKPLASKTIFTEQDIAAVDAFIKETDDGEQIAVRAQSKAFSAAQKVQAFEDGVKAAAKGKNPQAFIESLIENPQLVNKIPGAGEAAQAFVNSVKGDAAILKAVGEQMKTQGKKPTSQNYINQSPPFGFVKASFGTIEKSIYQPAEELLPDTSPFSVRHDANFMVLTGLEIALITLAAAYIGVTTTRLLTGDIGRCIRRALRDHRACIREERADGSGLSRAERIFCRGEFLLMAAACVLLPI